MKGGGFEQFRNSVLEKAYDQAIWEYGSWQKYKKEQWKSLLVYGKEDLLDLALALLSSSRRLEYPIPALDLSAYTIKKFNLDKWIANSPVEGGTPNARTGEIDPVQWLSLKVKFGVESRSRLHLGGHLLARCALLSENPSDYLNKLQPDISPFTTREFDRVIRAQCPYENEAQGLRWHMKEALKEAKDFLYSSDSPSEKLMKEIEGEVLIEKDMADIAKDL